MTDLHEMAEAIRMHPSRIVQLTEPYQRRIYGFGRSFDECLAWSKLFVEEFDWRDDVLAVETWEVKVKHYSQHVEKGYAGVSHDPLLEKTILKLFPKYSNSIDPKVCTEEA
jgi:hypothetical protein